MSKRRPRFTTRFSRLRDLLQTVISRRLTWFTPRARLYTGFGLLVLACTVLLHGFASGGIEFYQVGEIVHNTVISPADITATDVVDTKRRRNEAMVSARPVFHYDPAVGDYAVQTFNAAWANLQKQAQDKELLPQEYSWQGPGGPNIGTLLGTSKLDSASHDSINRLLKSTFAQYVYRDEDAENLKQDVLLVDPRMAGAGSVLSTPQLHMTSVSDARQKLAGDIKQLSGFTPPQSEALRQALMPLVQANVSFDSVATENARKLAADNVMPSTVTLKRNQVVAREGDRVTEPMLAQFTAIREYGRGGKRWHHFFGLLVIIAALFGMAWKFIAARGKTVRHRLTRTVAFALVGSAILVETVLMRVGFTLADRIAATNSTAPFNDPFIWSLAIPFAAGSLLVALLLDTQIAFITSLITALFAAMLAPNGVQMAVYALISSTTAVYGINRYRERQSVTLAGIIAGLANVVMAIALIAYSQQPIVLNTVLAAGSAGILGGLLTSIFTAGGLPVNESVFGILTDVKLLELSNADLPVLGQLALRAPGTNQHSHAVGQLAEEACRAIGASGLLARIGALYHDIGKLAAPDMFVENQQGNNPHDRIRPSNSARIITSHVTYGQKLAKEIGLPAQIADFIPQHHGTRTLHFFLRKAQAQAAEGEVVDEAEFRYPGPKPQFKEAAIMMLADSCEAGARSLARPDPENIRIIVNKITDAVLSDGQLDECDLTLREVTKIRESIINSLVAIYHARIDYPGFNPLPVTAPLPPLFSGEIDTEERGVSYSRPSEVPVNRSGEVEDEALTRTRSNSK